MISYRNVVFSVFLLAGCATYDDPHADVREHSMADAHRAFDMLNACAMKGARSNAMLPERPQDIADLVIAACSPQKATYLESSRQAMIDAGRGTYETRTMVFRQMPTFEMELDERLRRAVVARVLMTRKEVSAR